MEEVNLMDLITNSDSEIQQTKQTPIPPSSIFSFETSSKPILNDEIFSALWTYFSIVPTSWFHGIPISMKKNSYDLLFLGFINGFDVWDISDRNHMDRTVSVRIDDSWEESLVECSCVVPLMDPVVTDGAIDVIENHRPVIALIGNERSSTWTIMKSSTDPSNIIEFPLSILRFYSLKNHDYIDLPNSLAQYLEGHHVYSISATNNIIIISIMNPSSMNHTLLCVCPASFILLGVLKDLHLSPITGLPVFSIGNNFLAYSSSKPLQKYVNDPHVSFIRTDTANLEQSVDEQNTIASSYRRKARESLTYAKDALKDIGGYVYKGGERIVYNGKEIIASKSDSDTNKKEADKITNEELKLESVDPIMFALHHAQSQRSGNLGSIRIVDMKSIVKSVPVNQWKSTVTPPEIESFLHFQPHQHALHMLKFDYSGLFLATLSVEGHTVHIWEIKKKPFRNALDELGSGEIKHCYKLHRGMTSATIEDISWNNTGRFISATSSKGTVHIWKLDGQNLYGPKFSHVTVSQPQALARVRIKLEYSSNYVISYRLKPVKLETLDAKEDLPFSFDEQDRDSKKENMLKTSGYLHDIHTESHNNCERKYPFLRKFGALRCFFREDSSSTTTASEIQELFCINTRGSSGGSSSKIMTNQSTSLTGGTNMPNSLFSSSMSSSSTSANPRSFPRSNGALSKFTGTGSISGVNETKSTSVVCILSLHRMYTSLNSSDNNSVWNMFPVENPVSTFSSYLTSAISVVPSTIYSVAGVVAGIGNAESANIGAAEGIDSQNGLSIEENRDPNDVGSVSYGNPVSQIKRGPKVVSSAKPTAAQSPVNQYRGQIEDVVWWNLNIS